MMLSDRRHVARTREAVDELCAADERLRTANAVLAEQNEDLRALFHFAGGLASRAHDRAALVAYAEDALGHLAERRVEVRLGTVEGGLRLSAAGRCVGSLHVDEATGEETERWTRLREAILHHLAVALESAGRVEEIRKTLVQTVGALARSMEAKDYYTVGDTERVSSIAVALAKRLGFAAGELDAIEIGALLHDIGKIGIPERILHKPGPLDEEEWKVMREHPIISEYILQDVDLHPLVREIARSSHERVDGVGYPDGHAGEEIPLAARIVLVADAFDALTSDRPYRPARTVGEAMEELRSHAGTQFCPKVIATLEEIYREQPKLLGTPPPGERAEGTAA
jgi:HD-GYP domain-containing protein (c-di-GMP phosphodiesterase class II)